MKCIIFLLTCLLSGLVARGQGPVNATDSIKNQQLETTTQLLKDKERQILIDSLRKQALRQEIKELKTSETQRRRELEKKYNDLIRQDSARHAGKAHQIAEMKKLAKGFPVVPFTDTLFYFYTKVGSFNVQERAQAVAGRIRKLYENHNFAKDSLKMLDSDSETDIMYGNSVILSITDTDALWFNRSRQNLAIEYIKQIQDAVTDEQEKNSFKNILKKISLAFLVLTGLFLIVYLISKVFKFIKRSVYSKRHIYLNGLKIKNYQLLDQHKQLKSVLLLLNALRLASMLISVYLALPLLFSIFPETKDWSETLINWILAPVTIILYGLINYLPNLFTIGVIFIFTRYSVKLLHFFANEIEQEKLRINGFYKDWAQPTFQIIRFLLYVFMFIVIFPYLPGSDSPIFRGVSVFLGILFSLGSSSAISNMVAGLVITYMRPFKIHDRVKIGEITGEVLEKTLLVTRIRTIKNEDITVPNSSILSGHTINFTTSSQELGLILNTGVTIGYDVPWKQVHELLISAARATNGILAEKEPFVLQTSLEDFYVAYQLNAYTNQPHRMALIYSELHQNIQDKFNEAGVEIMSPHYQAMRNGSAITIPAGF